MVRIVRHRPFAPCYRTVASLRQDRVISHANEKTGARAGLRLDCSRFARYGDAEADADAEAAIDGALDVFGTTIVGFPTPNQCANAKP